MYDWQQVRHCPQIILVEGLFDFAVLWQAGFHNVTCSMGSHLNALQYRELCDFGGTVYLAFDSDFNQSGQQGAQRISACLASRGLIVRRIQLPNGHDPNSFFVQGAGDTQQFQRLLEEAHT